MRPIVMLAAPAGEMVHTRFHECMIELVGYTLTQGINHYPDGIELARNTVSGSILPDLRHKLVREAQKQRCTHILFTDSDMMVPPEALIRLLQHDKDIVGVNYPMKVGRHQAPRPTGESLELKPLHTGVDTDGLEEVNYVATGFAMVKMSVFEALEIPWFLTPWNEKFQGYMTEDVYFMLYARHKGFKIYCDQSLSKEVFHVGQKWFHLDEVEGWDPSIAGQQPKAMTLTRKDIQNLPLAD